MNLDPKKQLVLEDERSAETRYIALLEEKAKYRVTLSVPRNSQWANPNSVHLGTIHIGNLVGRVALSGPQEEFDGLREFYVGERHVPDLDGVPVFGWAAPVSCTFFRGSDHHELCEEVAAVRAFIHQGNKIADFEDEVVKDGFTGEPFRKIVLRMPAPPRLQSPRLPSAKSDSQEHKATLENSPPAEAGPREDPGGTDADLDNDAATGGSQIRAAGLLRQKLAAPRQKTLSPVLSTLQPDQYELVSLPPNGNVFIEGLPGTGKTIIATHRAAYLVDEELPREKMIKGDVLVVGPTSEFTVHVRDVISRLSGRSPRIMLCSLAELIQRILNGKSPAQGKPARSWHDADRKLGTLGRSAIFHYQKDNGTKPSAEQAYELMRHNGNRYYQLTRDPEWADYLRALPSYQAALGMRALGPLLALLSWELTPSTALNSISHVIVDESQDVTALEWMLLSTINDQGNWTIIGDLNQRRSDHTLASWSSVANVLGIGENDYQLRQLRRAFRSTRPILEFANRLLPRSERRILAFQQDGPKPSALRVPIRDYDRTVLEHLERLIAAYPYGSVAIITVDDQGVRKALAKSGWKLQRDDYLVWERGSRTVTVTVPDSARGLEFDAVIVLEPANFPKNFGRQGPLFTSLTRANRELVIIYTTSLPDPLRRR